MNDYFIQLKYFILYIYVLPPQFKNKKYTNNQILLTWPLQPSKQAYSSFRGCEKHYFDKTSICDLSASKLLTLNNIMPKVILNENQLRDLVVVERCNRNKT